MSLKSKIIDSKKGKYGAQVTRRNQLVVAPLDFSQFYNVKAELVNTAYNLITPKTRKCFVITDVILYANKNVGVSDATVVLYESDGPSSLTETNVIINQEMPKYNTLPLTGLNVNTAEGAWINIKTDDDDIFANIAGYYIDA